MAKIFLINGPNLNLLGTREPEIYGHETLPEICQQLQDHAKTLNHQLDYFQSNGEHLILDAIHQAKKSGIDFIIINPGALTHTSIALRDALLGVAIPFIEIHISNVYAREHFRRHSYLSDIAKGVISGLGIYGYHLALLAANKYLKT